ncbi:MAG TPA: hypothetical protein VND96_06875 [Candidatus Micrarchaeaceae archaeon]|nr:hypothetical protein [Candidatus Micrarchaeaceae archaeon]
MELWVAVGTGVLALATFALAGISGWNVNKTGKLVSATELLATNAKATIDEIQKDRELAYRPYISWNASLTRTGQSITAGRAYPVNFGRGPVVHGLCCLAWIEPQGGSTYIHHLLTTDLFDLSADSSGGDGLQMSDRAGAMADADVAGNEVTNEGVRVAFCQDQLGNYYRFVPYHPAEIWRPKVGDRPKWIEFYADQFIRLSKK